MNNISPYNKILKAIMQISHHFLINILIFGNNKYHFKYIIHHTRRTLNLRNDAKAISGTAHSICSGTNAISRTT